MKRASERAATDGGAPLFRLDNEQLAFRFTATLSDRHGKPIERLPSPQRLDDWLTVNNLALENEHATLADLELAHALREAIHRTGASIASAQMPNISDYEAINQLLREVRPVPELTQTGLHWNSEAGHHVRSALALIAYDAAIVLGSTERDHVKACEAPECRGLYVDTSRGQNRRWCSMNICGNRAKKAKLRRSATSSL